MQNNQSLDTCGYYGGVREAASRGHLFNGQAKRGRLTPNARGMIIVMVGLPGRGKSFISRKLEGFLRWEGFKTRLFNVGRYRRDADSAETSGRSDFFDAQNSAAVAAREAAASAALDDCLCFLDGQGQRAILDATNSTRSRRKHIIDRVRAHSDSVAVIFLEVICTDQEVLDANMQNKVRHSPDFNGMSFNDAMADLKARIGKYEAVYEPVMDDEGSYIKLYDLSSKIMSNHIYGHALKCVLPFLAGVHIGFRPIWLVRAFPCQQNMDYPCKSDQEFVLSDTGQQLASALARFVEARAAHYWQTSGKEAEETHVVTSTFNRAAATVSCVPVVPVHSSALNPIDTGTIGGEWWEKQCSGPKLPWEEVERRHPEFMRRWQQDRLHCRFPCGECYMDVIRRLESLLLDVEMCTVPVLLVSHLSVIQLLGTYFKGMPVQDFWKLDVPKGVVLELTPTLGGSYLYEEHPLV